MSSQPIAESGTRLGAAERRQQLLSAARQTFGSKGYTATSMNDIALASHVTKPVLYQHFDSKGDLFLEVLAATASELNDAISAVLKTAATGREKVERGIEVYVEFFNANPENYRVLYGEGVRSEPTFASELRTIQNTINDLAAEHIEIEQLDHDLRRLAAEAISGMLESAVGHWLDGGKAEDASQVASLLSSLAWRGLRAAP